MSSLVAVPSLREFFKQLLLEAADHQHVHLAEVTEFYLVNLLAEFAAAEKLFAEDEEIRIRWRCFITARCSKAEPTESAPFDDSETPRFIGWVSSQPRCATAL